MSSPGLIKKIITLGDQKVGKSSIIFRYSQGTYEILNTTYGSNFTPVTKKKFGYDLTLSIHDTSGQELYKSIAKIYYRNTHAVILIYKQSDRNTFENLNYWVNELRSYLNEEVPIYLVASQCDLEMICVDEEDVKRFCEENNIKSFFKVSALTGLGIEELFDSIANDLMSGVKSEVVETRKSISLDLNIKKKKKCQC